MRTLLPYLCALLLFPQKTEAQPLSYTKEDSAFCVRVLDSLHRFRAEDAGERVLRAARFLLGRPYRAATLEGEPETLTVNLRELDCTTLVESALALAQPVTSFTGYAEALRGLRYRDGEVRYTGRLHYMADWLYENARRGVVEDVTPELPGSEPLTLALSFMSSHPASYPALAGHPGRVVRMKEVESAVNARPGYAFLPKGRVKGAERFIRDGDIIGFVTTAEGLDVTHVGIACRVEGRLTFIHASSAARMVIVNPDTLEAYLGRQKSCRGIWVIRPTN